MEDKVLASGEIGSVGNYELAWKSAALIFTINIKAGPLKFNTGVELDSMEAFDELAKAIPGTIDDAVISVVKSVLKPKAA